MNPIDQSAVPCVIFNPASGKRRARKRLDALMGQWASRAEFWPTERPGHAAELARRAADQGFKVVAAAGGDGTVHEVANGLLESGRTDVGLAVIPIGSANDYAFSLRREQITHWRCVDVGVVRAAEVNRYFVCCLGMGFSANVTAQAKKISHLQGVWLYGLATLRALRRHWCHFDLTISQDDGPNQQMRALLVSLMVGQREGGFLIAPGARLDDGQFDAIIAGEMSRWDVLRLLPRMIASGVPQSHPQLRFGRCRKMVVTSRQPIAVHTDGELVFGPEDEVQKLEIELLPGRLQVQLGLESNG